ARPGGGQARGRAAARARSRRGFVCLVRPPLSPHTMPVVGTALSGSAPIILRSAGALVLVLLGCAGTVRAQGAPSFEWELLGLEDKPLDGAFFAPGPAEDGSADTLYAHGYRGLWRRTPDGLWSGNLCEPCGVDFAIRTKVGYLLVGARAGATDVDRSTDGGLTWERDVFDGVTTLFQSTVPALGGAVYGC